MSEKGKLWLKIGIVSVVLVAIIAVVMLVEPLVAKDDGTIYKDVVGDTALTLNEPGTSFVYKDKFKTDDKIDNAIITTSVAYSALPKNPTDDAYVFVALRNVTSNKYYFMGSEVPVNETYIAVTVKLSEVVTLDYKAKQEFIGDEKVKKTKDCIFVGVMYENGTDIKMHTNGSIIDEGTILENKYKYVFTTIDFVDKNQDNVNDDITASLPNKDIKGLSFAGWYHTSNFKNGTISSTNLSDTDNGLVYARYINYADGGIVVLICMVIVFIMLAILYGITSLLKYLAPKAKNEVKETMEEPVVSKPVFSINDITDDDMMAAALVATIDYHNECKKDVRVVSIKEIR